MSDIFISLIIEHVNICIDIFGLLLFIITFVNLPNYRFCQFSDGSFRAFR